MNGHAGDRCGGRTKRRAILAAGMAAALARTPVVAAVRPNARVGYLEQLRESDGERLYREFVEGLQERGYAERRNLTMLRRSADAQPERLRPLAAAMAADKVDVILATTTEAALSAKVTAPGIPTVFIVSSDPV